MQEASFVWFDNVAQQKVHLINAVGCKEELFYSKNI